MDIVVAKPKFRLPDLGLYALRETASTYPSVDHEIQLFVWLLSKRYMLLVYARKGAHGPTPPARN